MKYIEPRPKLSQASQADTLIDPRFLRRLLLRPTPRPPRAFGSSCDLSLPCDRGSYRRGHSRISRGRESICSRTLVEPGHELIDVKGVRSPIGIHCGLGRIRPPRIRGIHRVVGSSLFIHIRPVLRRIAVFGSIRGCHEIIHDF